MYAVQCSVRWVFERFTFKASLACNTKEFVTFSCREYPLLRKVRLSYARLGYVTES